MERSCIWNFNYANNESRLPKSWEEFCEMQPVKSGEFFIDDFSRILKRTDFGDKRYKKQDRNMLPNLATAKSIRSLMQLIQLRDCYNGDWGPDWKNRDEIKHIIQFDAEEIHCDTWIGVSASPLYFKTAELRDEFLHYFRDLIEKLKPLYGIKEGGEE